MNKMFLVKEVHDCRQLHIIGVCPNRDLADKLKKENEKYSYLKTIIEEVDLYTLNTDIILYGIDRHSSSKGQSNTN